MAFQIMNKIILISFFTILNSLAQTSDSSMIEFNWKGIGNFNATLFVPDNYHQNDEYYGEGIFTTLTYEDSSCIFLHNLPAGEAYLNRVR